MSILILIPVVHSRAWGLAAINAHRAYNDTTSLNYAIAMWNQTSMYQIQASDVARGHDQVQNVTLPANCNGGTFIFVPPIMKFILRSQHLLWGVYFR